MRAVRQEFSMLLLALLPGRRAGRDPQGDAARHPIRGRPALGVTGEAVEVRRAPDLEALRRDLEVRVGALCMRCMGA